VHDKFAFDIEKGEKLESEEQSGKEKKCKNGFNYTKKQ
jgi:hypothetical protein